MNCGMKRLAATSHRKMMMGGESFPRVVSDIITKK